MSVDADVRDGMRILSDVGVPTSDGGVLSADVFLPPDEGRYPVVLTCGPYAKGLAFQEGYPDAWNRMARDHPDVTAGSTNAYQSWEVADPEKWVPHAYAVVRVDSRGCGRSPGYVDHFSARETQDLYECIEWAGTQPWSSGKVGLAGVSYYAINQWHVASRNPPHLAAIIPWEGAGDFYRDATYHGGIRCTFMANWYDLQVKTVQHGLADRGPRHPVTGALACGDEKLIDAELEANRSDFGAAVAAHPLDDGFHRERSGDWADVTVPFLSAGNWGGQGLHLRGNVEAFVRARSEHKWLELHGLEHWTHFYTDYGVGLQRRFFDRFLKGLDNGWDDQPPVILNVRTIDGFVRRDEHEWPLARTEWTRLHLDARALALRPEPAGSAGATTYEAMGDGVTFLGAALERETEVTGPVAAKLFVSSSTTDADLFCILRVFDPAGEEVVFQGAIDPHTPVGQGWLRASHRKLDRDLSLPYRPYHTHDEVQPLEPGEVYELDVEIWPTSIVVPAGYRIGLTVRGTDYVYAGASGGRLSQFRNELRGCGPFLHDDPGDRPADVFAGRVTMHTGDASDACVLLPVVPPQG